ncbi:MAG: flagellar motor stator protein MotA [Melioribacteraceae bacterium]|nr:flagellar motor stator protein MotA [Melioribacteraceae bacterium]
MFIIIGAVVVLASMMGGFMMAGGQPAVLLQWSEFIVIGGVGFGALMIMVPMPTIVKIFGYIPKAMGHKHVHTHDNLDLLKAFYELFLLAQRDGLLAIEKHIEKPEASDIFSKSPILIANTSAVTYVCDTLKVMLSGGVPPHEVEALMDIEIETYEAEHMANAHLVAKVGDGFPAIGIVAAVLGIIITMGSINDGAEAVGHHVAAALVGTFLGILLSYGFVGPLATNIEHMILDNVRFMETIKSCVIAYAKGNPPIVAVEIGRRTLFSDSRPSFGELEAYLRGK